MAVVYRVDLKDTTGSVVAQFKQFISLSVDMKWGDKGNYQFIMSGFDQRWQLFGDDYLVEVWMQDPDEGIPWQVVFTGIHKTPVYDLEENGNQTFASYGPSPEEILDKDYILWPTGSPQAEKSGLISTVMREYVIENLGPTALQANGRDLDGVVPGLVLGLDPLVGPSWSGSRSRKNILSVLKELASHAALNGNDVDFRMISTAGYGWLFECGKLGVDRSTVGLDTTTGLNAAGNVPVVFSAIRGNIQSFTRSKSRYNTVTSAVVPGQSVGAFRPIGRAENALELAASPIARRVKVFDGSNNAGEDLNVLAQTQLWKNEPAEKFDFVPRKSGQLFFRDYFLGDIVTAEDNGAVFHKRVVGAKIEVSESNPEKISFTYRDV